MGWFIALFVFACVLVGFLIRELESTEGGPEQEG